jgi:hypothetical protein
MAAAVDHPAAAGAAAPPPVQGQAAAADDGGWMGTLQQVVRTLALIMLFNNLSRSFLGSGTKSASFSSSSSHGSSGGGSSSSSSSSGAGSVGERLYGDAHAQAGLYRGPLYSLWREHTPMVRVCWAVVCVCVCGGRGFGRRVKGRGMSWGRLDTPRAFFRQAIPSIELRWMSHQCAIHQPTHRPIDQSITIQKQINKQPIDRSTNDSTDQTPPFPSTVTRACGSTYPPTKTSTTGGTTLPSWCGRRRG